MSNPKPPPGTDPLARLKLAFGGASRWLASLSRPARVLLGSTLLLTLSFGGYIVYRQAHETYAVLFTQLDRDDAAAIVAKLKELKTPYRLELDGTTVEVPEERVGDVRLELASAGMPRGGGVGFESFDKLRLGATDFEQRVLYRRALEGELARTIGTIGAIQSVRVHLVLPEKSVFISRAEPASASIVLRLRSGRSLGASEVAGIVHLTAASVSGLNTDHVAVVTTEGEMLKRPHLGGEGAADLGGEDRVARQRGLESQLEERVRSMIEKVVGAGHVDVRVSAEIDDARVERVEDHYDPTRSAVRSEETTIEHSGAALDEGVTGVPGAESNVPAAGAAAAVAPLVAAAGAKDAGAPKLVPPTRTAGSEQPLRESHTRSYEVDHVTEKRTTNGGEVRRLAVAVIVDAASHVEAGKRSVVLRDEVELDKLTALVRGAVGANDARGDIVTVSSIPFEVDVPAVEIPAAPVSPPSLLPPFLLARPWRAYAPAAAGVVLVVIVLFAMASVRRRSRRSGEQLKQLALLGPTPSLTPAGQLEEGHSNADARTAALRRAAEDPATAAMVLRFWLETADATPKQNGAGPR